MGEIVRFRHNVLDISSISTFVSIKGGVNSNCKDVYFVRLLGMNGMLIEEIIKMDQLLTQQMIEERLMYKRILKLPKLTSVEDVKFYSDSYRKWVHQNGKEIHVKSSLNNEPLRQVLSNAAHQVLAQHKVVNARINESIEKNFLVKVLFWFDYVAKDLMTNWHIRSSFKIVASNVFMEQEYLFYYFLTLVGFDVLLIQNEKDIDSRIDQLDLSKKYVLGTYGKCNIPPYEQQSKVKSQITKPIREPEKKSESKVEKTLEQLACLASSVVLIAIHDSSGEVIGSGSGIMIGKNGYILTNCHVANGGVSYSIRVEDDEQIYRTDELIKYNFILDLAILRINRTLDALPIYSGKAKLVRGQKVVAIGSPLGLFNSVSDGIISGFRHIEEVDMIQFTAPTSHGSSGGAVLNMQGEVVGISTAGIDSGQNLNLAVSYECINHFIRGFV